MNTDTMINEILLKDLQATIGHPAFKWPTISNEIAGIILEGYKYTLVCSDMLFGIPFSVSIYDPDNFLVQLNTVQQLVVRDWVKDNVLPNYLNKN